MISVTEMNQSQTNNSLNTPPSSPNKATERKVTVTYVRSVSARGNNPSVTGNGSEGLNGTLQRLLGNLMVRISRQYVLEAQEKAFPTQEKALLKKESIVEMKRELMRLRRLQREIKLTLTPSPSVISSNLEQPPSPRELQRDPSSNLDDFKF